MHSHRINICYALPMNDPSNLMACLCQACGAPLIYEGAHTAPTPGVCPHCCSSAMASLGLGASLQVALIAVAVERAVEALARPKGQPAAKKELRGAVASLRVLSEKLATAGWQS